MRCLVVGESCSQLSSRINTKYNVLVLAFGQGFKTIVKLCACNLARYIIRKICTSLPSQCLFCCFLISM